MTGYPSSSVFDKVRHKPWREILRVVWGRLRLLFGLPAPMRTPDRLALENVIIPFFTAQKPERVLFVGVDWFTKHYNRFFANTDYWTIEIDHKRKRFGATQHVVGSIENLDRYFPERHFDLIFCNGVYGWGLDEPEACERAFEQCFIGLRDGGVLVLGWNDVEEHRPVALESIKSLGRFSRLCESPYRAWRYEVPTPSRHIYDFYTKTASRS